MLTIKEKCELELKAPKALSKLHVFVSEDDGEKGKGGQKIERPGRERKRRR